MLHETENWLAITDCPNTFNRCLQRWPTNCVPALMPPLTNCYDGTGPSADWSVSSGGLQGDHDGRLLQRCPAGGPYGTCAVLCGVVTGAEAFEGEGESGSPCVHGRGLSRPYEGPRPTRLRVIHCVPPARATRHYIFVVVVSLAKTAALPPKGQAPTAVFFFLLESTDVRIAEGGVPVVGIPIGSDKYVLEPAVLV